jgi:hypothetical protein
MLYGAEVAVCSEINTKRINTVWTEYQFLGFSCWCTQPGGFIRFMLVR